MSTGRMNIEDLAREAGMLPDGGCWYSDSGNPLDAHDVEHAHLARFAALVRAAALDEAAVAPSEALYAFAGWLTSRDEHITMGSIHDAAPAADAVHAFCISQGWASPRENYIERIKPYPGHAAALKDKP